MSKSNTLEDGILNLILNNANLANIGDVTGLRGSSSAGNLYISLHTATPGEGGAQDANEIAYGGYARVAINRSGGQWSVSGGVAANAVAITFPTVTSGSGYAYSWAIGTSSAGAGTILYTGEVDVPHTYVVGEYPYFPIGSLQVGEE